MVCFEKDHLLFSLERIDHIFGKKEKSSFLKTSERSYSSATFVLKRPSFQNIWKKKKVFSCCGVVVFNTAANEVTTFDLTDTKRFTKVYMITGLVVP